MAELSVVIPTLNEEENIPELFKKLKELKLSLEIIIVDSDSRDKTRELAKKKGEKYKLDAKVFNTGKLDLSNSAVYGFKKASSSILVLMDSDLQHPPEMIKKMFEEIQKQNADLVIASRFIKDSEVKFSLKRKIMSKGFILLSYFFFPRLWKIKDPSSGFFMFRKDVIKNKNLRPLGFRTLLEILVRGDYSKVIELPYTFYDRKKGQSKIGFNQVILHLKHLNRLIFEK